MGKVSEKREIRLGEGTLKKAGLYGLGMYERFDQY